jgi:hypothetical protein
MVKNGNGIVATLDRQPLVHGFLTVVRNHHIHPELCQLPRQQVVGKEEKGLETKSNARAKR